MEWDNFKLIELFIIKMLSVSLSLLGLIATVVANAHIDDSQLMRKIVKRQLYRCGTFPNEYYSETPCQTTNQCPNGGVFLNVGCTVSAQCTPFHRGISTCINNCCCTVPESRPPPSNVNRFGFCPSGQLSEVRCSGRGQCERGESCMTGLCCTNTGDEFAVTCGGISATGSCSAVGSCSDGVCTASNYCCECSVGRSAGKCPANRQCPAGYTCNNSGYCCPGCPNNVMPFGACRNGVCGGGRTCRAGNICC